MLTKAGVMIRGEKHLLKNNWKSHHKKTPTLYFMCKDTLCTSADTERYIQQNDLLNLKCFSNTKNSSFCSATQFHIRQHTDQWRDAEVKRDWVHLGFFIVKVQQSRAF